MSAALLPAFPYFGAKTAAAEAIWEGLGADVANYVEPFCGTGGVLLARPRPGKIETLNDAHAFIPNFLRAIRSAPDKVSEHAAWPVSEIDMHARHTELVRRADEAFVEHLRESAGWFDAEIAGWWVWGQSIWIGSGWCDTSHRNVSSKQRPHLSGGAMGVARRKLPRLGGGAADHGGGANVGVGINRRLPHLAGPNNRGKVHEANGSDGSGVGYGRGIFATGRREDIAAYFRALAQRLSMVRITCGDWKRVVTPAVTTSHGLTGVVLDPPYAHNGRAKVYAHDSADVAAETREWAVTHGEDPHLRIALCGYDGDHEMPSTWRCHAWKSTGGYGSENTARERIWFSPHCLGGERVAGPLFEAVSQ